MMNSDVTSRTTAQGHHRGRRAPASRSARAALIRLVFSTPTCCGTRYDSIKRAVRRRRIRAVTRGGRRRFYPSVGQVTSGDRV